MKHTVLRLHPISFPLKHYLYVNNLQLSSERRTCMRCGKMMSSSYILSSIMLGCPSKDRWNMLVEIFIP